MKVWLRSLRVRLLIMQLAVIIVGVVALVVVIEPLAKTFFQGHLDTMNQMMEGMMSGILERDLESAFDSSLGRALLISVAASTVAALALSAFATRRILAPLDSVRAASRRMAGGSYGERVSAPSEVELAALAADFNALAEALDTTEQRRVRLISEVAHELRTPLTTVEGYLEGMLDGVFDASEETLGASIREVRRIKRLADDLSLLSKTEEAVQPLNLVEIDVGGLASEVGDRLRPQFEAEAIDLVVDTAAGLVVRADPDRTTQVLTNILGNALAYTPSGGTVRVEATARDGMAVVRVTDTGKGLTAEQREAVFERFYRADPAAPGGSGIGLTIARSIARRQGGEVSAESAGPNRGSTFTLRLPLV
ncbi:MAG: sensor histidine kinase [Acidimicrobiia bacterium]